MAELSTIARPYAQGLWKALVEKGTTSQAGAIIDGLNALGAMLADSATNELVSDPKLSDDQIYDLLTGVLGGKKIPAELAGLLRVVVENGRLDALSEIATQVRTLKNESEGVADAYIETAFPLKAAEVAGLVKSLANKFPGVKLNPVVTVNPSLIGGVTIRVGDKVLDGSVRARLAKMQAALTA